MQTTTDLASINPKNVRLIDLNLMFSHSNLEQTINHYELIIDQKKSCAHNYFYLGLAYLLQERELEAQVTWFTPFAEASELESIVLINHLTVLLNQAVSEEFVINDINLSWLVRQSLWSIAPNQADNILSLVIIAGKLDILTAELLVEYQIDELLSTISIGEVDDLLLKQTIFTFLQKVQNNLGLRAIKYCLLLIVDSRNDTITDVTAEIFSLSYCSNPGLFSIELVEVCQSLLPDNLNICQALAVLYSDAGFHTKAITSAKKYYQVALSQMDKLLGSYLIQRSNFAAGNWQDGNDEIDRHYQLLQDIIENFALDLAKQQVQHLITSSVFLPYTEDNPLKYRSIQNQIALTYQNSIDSIIDINIFKSALKNTFIPKKQGVLRIGYLASTLREHSVGWLSRWLFQYHDRQSFQIFNYCIDQSHDDTFNHKWFRDKVDISYYSDNFQKIATQIKSDEIDILIDLDSLTHDTSCLVTAYKPAPVQVTWLGWDASGSPSIDYFIADPYVLPNNAQDYYREKIWRLPQTYLGVEGFEVGTATFQRKDLGIPNNSIIYLSSQTGYKRHPECIRAQMEIIKAVPNSYFLIKGKSDAETIKSFFGKLAAEVGISLDRLRFLERDRDEQTHRANLAIADIVLDTFPYNGATTTLETLWMGIPMVTQVGQQFAARNSYTFMLNAGIEEGIAWSQSEYIEWGIKLGLDRDLRDKIAGKLRSGRTTAPVWNAKQFTLDMEDAYRQMWAKYQAELN